ncbi:MAG: isoleucine--tRNA ligase [Actinomycetota bacterium]|nr:isoleucine--tRNA ligase [Actinomycetota bacterium]
MPPPLRPFDHSQSLPELEEQVLERWRERDVFAESVRRREGAEPFLFYEGPPTANGPPGVHHVLSRVFKDVFPRYRTMRGHLVHRKAGWDCHGLPVELQVEQELGFETKDDIERYGVAEFNAKCRESVLTYVDEWDRLTDRIGFWIDTGDAYFTLDNSYIESVWWSLKQVWDQGLLYEGHKVVPYCPRCGTALSSHEVALGYEDVVDPSVYVRFPVRGEEGVSLLAWTTTPWTLLSNAALAVNPEIEYVRAHVGEETVILARVLVEQVLGEGVETEPAGEIVGLAYEPPFPYVTDFGERGHTVLPADFVTTEDGTGVVHTAIAFGEDDFALGERFGLTLQNPVLPNGTFDERIEPFAGRGVREAGPDIVDALRSSGRLFASEDYEHAYPHCWRCGTALLYYAKSSWYVRTSERRDELLASNEEVTWYPEHIKHGRFGNWLENNVDWALSRERYWGTPLPIWRSEDGTETVCVGSVEELRSLGADVPDDLHRPYIDDATFERAGKTFRRVPELIDVWWDSGCMPFAQHHAPFEHREVFQERFPADYICEALDQTRGWFYSLLAISTLLYGRSSYETVLCLGLILDPEGQKMSKSKGNVVVPWEVIETHGADALRWYYFTSKQPWDGYRFSLETVGESVRQFMLTLWNTYGFYVLYANVNHVDPPAGAQPDRRPGEHRTAESPEGLTDLDNWALSRLSGATETAIERLDDYDTTGAGRAVAAFVDDLSNWYVRRSRRRFWDGDPAAFWTLHTCLVTVSKLLAPLIPFVTDEIYDNLDGSEPSVHLCDYPSPGKRDTELEWQMQVARDAVELGRSARAQAKVKVRQPLAEAAVVAAPNERAAIERLHELVLDELNVRDVRFVADAEELGRWELKPNYRALGPRFGKHMPQVAAAVAGLDPARVREGGAVGIFVDGREHTLEAGDVQMVLQPLEGYQLERAGTHAVALNLELDEDLRREGLAREVVHAVQAARKGSGLKVEDRISLTLGGDPELLEAARAHEGYVSGETLATSLAFEGGEAGESATIEGRELRIAVEPIQDSTVADSKVTHQGQKKQQGQTEARLTELTIDPSSDGKNNEVK